MRRIFVLLASFAFAAPVYSQDVKSNKLTPKEIADGWLLLFDGEATFGWSVKGPAEVKNGEWLIGGDEAASATSTTHFADGVIAFQYRHLGKKTKADFMLRGRDFGLAGDPEDPAWRDEQFGFEKGEITQKVA